MFNTMISKTLIQWLWVLLSIGVILAAIRSYNALFFPDGMDLLTHLLFAAIGLVIVRLLCEQMIVLFLMHENLQRSARSLEEMQRHQYIISSKLTAQPVPQAAQSAVSATPRPAVAEPPRIAQPARKGGWESAYDSTKE